MSAHGWIEEARMAAAACWCDGDTQYITMDVRLAEAVAQRIAAWMETAAQAQRNTEFYRDLIDECARAIGPEAYRADDGTLTEDPIRLRVPEIIRQKYARDSTRGGGQ